MSTVFSHAWVPVHVASTHKPKKLKLKEDVPRRGEQPQMGSSSGRNFVAENKSSAVQASPKRTQHKQVGRQRFNRKCRFWTSHIASQCTLHLSQNMSCQFQ